MVFPHEDKTSGFWTIPWNQGKPGSEPLFCPYGDTLYTPKDSDFPGLLCDGPVNQTQDRGSLLLYGEQQWTLSLMIMGEEGSSLHRQFHTCFVPLTQETPASI